MGSVSDPIHSIWVWYRTFLRSVWNLYRIPYTLYGICIKSHTLRMGSESGPIHSACDLHRAPCTPYGIWIGPHHSVWGLYQITCSPPGICILSCRGPIQAVYDLIGTRYRLYAIIYGSNSGCMRSYGDPIQAVCDPIGGRYGLYPIL